MWKGVILPRVGGFTILIQKPPPTDQLLDIKLGVNKESWDHYNKTVRSRGYSERSYRSHD